LAKYH